MSKTIKNKPIFIISIIILFTGIFLLFISYIPVQDSSFSYTSEGIVAEHLRSDVFINLRFVGIMLVIPAALILWVLGMGKSLILPVILLSVMAILVSFFLFTHLIHYSRSKIKWIEVELEEAYPDENSILDFSDLDKAELTHVKISEDTGEIVFECEQGVETYIKIIVLVDVESNKDYLICFEIKKTRDPSRGLEFGFFGKDYDNPEQQLVIEPPEMTWDYLTVKRIINSGSIPPTSENIYFRIVTNSHGEIVIKGLKIYEI